MWYSVINKRLNKKIRLDKTISLKLITAEVNLGLLQLCSRYTCVCICACACMVREMQCLFASYRAIAMPYSAIPSYSDALSNGRNKGRNRGGPEKAASGVYEFVQSVSTSLLAREIARGRTNCSCRCCNYGTTKYYARRFKLLKKSWKLCESILKYIFCVFKNFFIDCYNNEFCKV